MSFLLFFISFIFFHNILFPSAHKAIERPSSSSAGAGPPFPSFLHLLFLPLCNCNCNSSLFLRPPSCTHLTMRHRISHILLSLAFAWSLLGLVSAAPALVSSSRETVYRRQEVGKPLTGPEEVTKVQRINTFVVQFAFSHCVC